MNLALLAIIGLGVSFLFVMYYSINKLSEE